MATASGREVMAQELAVNIRAVDVDGKVAPGDSLSGARLGIEGMVDRIDSLGVERMLEIAPDFEGIELPSSGQGPIGIDAGAVAPPPPAERSALSLLQS